MTVTFASLVYFITSSRSRTIREAWRDNKINQRDKCYGHVTLASALQKMPARYASTEVDLIVRREWWIFSKSSGLFFVASKHLFVDNLRSNTLVFFNLLFGLFKQYPLSLTITHFSKWYFYVDVILLLSYVIKPGFCTKKYLSSGFQILLILQNPGFRVWGNLGQTH